MTRPRYASPALAAALLLLAGCARGPEPAEAGPAIEASGERLHPELEARIEAYLEERETEPIDAENASARAALLWDWANAFALAGHTLPVEMTITVHRFRGVEALGLPPSPVSLRSIDGFLEELALLRREPEALGRTTFSPGDPLVAASHASFGQIYTAGTRAPRRGAVFVLGEHFMSDHGTLQFEDPAADNHVVARASREGATLTPFRYPWVGMHAGDERSSELVAFRLGGSDLEPGDTVSFVYGDRTGGSRGFEVQTVQTDRLLLPIYLGYEEDGHLFSPSWAPLRVVGEPAIASIDVFAPSVVAAGEPLSLSIRASDRWYNRATGPIPQWEVTLDSEVVARVPAGGQAIAEVTGLVLRDPGVHRFEVRSADGALRARSNPVRASDRDAPRRVVWGELHAHTDFAEAQGTPEEYFRWGAEDARLDFIALTEHDAWLDAGEWRRLQELTQRENDEAGVVAFLAYEWTSPRANGGHHNVVFRRAASELVPFAKAPSLPELYRGLAANGPTEDVLVIPHAHELADWTTSDPALERLVEIYSMHGTFEWFGNLYLQRGWEVGFIGASDDHRAKPGLARPSHIETLGQRGGLAAALVPEPTPDAIFDALRGLSAYATSGERILLDAELNGFGMGTRQPEAAERRLSASVSGTAPIDRIDVVKNGEVALSRSYLRAPLRSRVWVQIGFESSSEVFPPADENPRLYRFWDGTLEVEGANLVSLDASGVDHHYRERVARDASVPALLRYHLETRGRRDTFLLELAGADAETALTFDIGPGREAGVGGRPPATDLPPLRFTVELGELRDGLFEHEIPLGRDTDRIVVQLVDVAAPLEREIEWVDMGPTRPGDYYYLRVLQLDGGRAWSSPWWVGGTARESAGFDVVRPLD